MAARHGVRPREAGRRRQPDAGRGRPKRWRRTAGHESLPGAYPWRSGCLVAPRLIAAGRHLQSDPLLARRSRDRRRRGRLTRRLVLPRLRRLFGFVVAARPGEPPRRLRAGAGGRHLDGDLGLARASAVVRPPAAPRGTGRHGEARSAHLGARRALVLGALPAAGSERRGARAPVERRRRRDVRLSRPRHRALAGPALGRIRQPDDPRRAAPGWRQAALRHVGSRGVAAR